PATNAASFDFTPSRSRSSPQNRVNRSQISHRMPPRNTANRAPNPAAQEEPADGEAFAPQRPKWKAEYTRDGSRVRVTDQHSGEKHVWDVIERPAKADKCKLDREMKLERDPANKDRRDLYLDIQNKIHLDMHTIMGRNTMTRKWGQVPLDVHAKIALAVRDAFPYLFRFKDNWAAYEIMRRVLSNKRDHTRRGRTGNRTQRANAAPEAEIDGEDDQGRASGDNWFVEEEGDQGDAEDGGDGGDAEHDGDWEGDAEHDGDGAPSVEGTGGDGLEPDDHADRADEEMGEPTGEGASREVGEDVGGWGWDGSDAMEDDKVPPPKPSKKRKRPILESDDEAEAPETLLSQVSSALKNSSPPLSPAPEPQPTPSVNVKNPPEAHEDTPKPVPHPKKAKMTNPAPSTTRVPPITTASATPTGAQPATTSAATRSAAAKSTAAKSATAKSTAARAAPTKSAAATSTTAKPTATSGTSKPAKSAITKSTTTAKPTTTPVAPAPMKPTAAPKRATAVAKPSATAKATASTTRSAAPAVVPPTMVLNGAPAPSNSGTPSASSSKQRKRPPMRPPPSETPVDSDQAAAATREAKEELIEEVSREKHPRIAHTKKRTDVVW
ncbi:hypothetical protein FRC10_006223, partial [Ceratobasidium sp. 414]